MLNKHNLNIARLATASESRYSLNGILVEPGRTAVTDGRLLMIVDTVPDMLSQDYPQTAGITATDTFKPFILDRKSSLDIAKAIPKPKKYNDKPILQMVAVGAESDANGNAYMAVNDTESARTFTPKKVGGNFPNIDQFVPKQEDAKFTIGLNLDLLIPLLCEMRDAASKTQGVTPALFSFTDGTCPVRIDVSNSETGQKAVAVLMPCKL